MHAVSELVAFTAKTTGRARLKLQGRSMEPLLRRGMVIEIEPLQAPPRGGDILVYRTPHGLVAHRFLHRSGGEFTTCGDAHPSRPERVVPEAVVGRVRGVWQSGLPGARRVDTPLFRVLGRAMALSRSPRAAARFVWTRLPLALGSPGRAEPPAFRALVAATLAFETGRLAEGAARLQDVPAAALLAVAKRHHASGCTARWLERAERDGVPVPAALTEPFRRVRWSNVLQAERVLARVRDVARRLSGAAIDAIFLKGGARLAAGEPDADAHFSGDVDVLVPARAGAAAVVALQAAGYRSRQSVADERTFARRHHHFAALYLAGSNVPVEVHVALLSRGKVSQTFSYADLAAQTVCVRGPAGDVRVLERVAAAVHLAYHGRDIRVWRDIVLLSRALAAFDPAERAGFDAIVARESRDAVRLRAAVALADAVRGRRGPVERAVARYAAWTLVREDLPPILRRRADLVEAFVGRAPLPFPGARLVLRRLKGWLYDCLATPAILHRLRRSARARDPLATLPTQ